MYKIIASLFVPSMVLILSIAYYMESLNVDHIDKLLIKPTCMLIVLFYIYFVYVECRRLRKDKDQSEKLRRTNTKMPYKELAILAMTALYVLIIQYLGFVVTSVVFMACMLYLLNVRNKLVIACFSITSSALLYFAFKVVLMVPLPGGLLGF